MAIGGGLIWLLVVVLALWAARTERVGVRPARLLIVGGGVVFPTVVLALLLVYGLWMLPQLRRSQPAAELRIDIAGEQWWWRVTYRPDASGPVALANEIRLPLGKPVELILTSPDVIHSFWIPSLAGKLDMIPGRTTRLVIEPTRTGVFHGACAEYCGASHTLMQIRAVVVEPQEFERWLAQQRAPAAPPADPLATRGREAFLANGCGGCHAIRGTAAQGRIGPDLTHVGSRLSLGAGALPPGTEAIRRFIAHTDALKPEVRMPAYGMLPPAQLEAIAHYLAGLK